MTHTSAACGRMYTVPQTMAPKAQREATAKIDPKAKVSRAFQSQKEAQYHRWLLQANKEHRLELAGLADLGEPQPDADTVQKWFLDAKSKDTFLETVRAAWKRDPG
jgi:hypothetical protein